MLDLKFGDNFTLAPWQQDFVGKFLSQPRTKSLLVAPYGTGKTIAALFIAQKMQKEGVTDATLVISERAILRDQWRHAAARYGIDLEKSFNRYLGGPGVSVTLETLRERGVERDIDIAAKARRWLIIADDSDHEAKSVAALVDRMLNANAKSRALFIARDASRGRLFESEFGFEAEFILDRTVIEDPSTEIRVAQSAPSFSILRRIQRSSISIDDLSWREFEKLIAALLEQDGYTVELMKGSKDGGVDVVAVKDLGASGHFKALWQAKKQGRNNKVGISVVRELADTRQELGASKGIIVTSSHLTRGALHRIERDKYILGKVDREDLDSWIRRTLLGVVDS
jgi:hypothetical protein